ncbi:hypothetical protein GCM10011511_20190 [Puia dinghuensis]|uniref:N-acetyltransferase domain-containing protein n=1 Tax=Puia dinghuensis TaxID=1792502 RepID=A0A8J2UCJ0_9BACT|nr:hypothetical protein GCM10011511_20190 [Puia dinghuensis]
MDNPAWSALTTEQSPFALGTGEAKRYRRNILPFAALAPGREASDLDPLITQGESFYLIGDLPVLPTHWTLEVELPCAQLIAPENLTISPATQEEIVLLGEADKTEMFQLITRVQPGYYHPDSRQLGEYYGIRQEGRLVAMAGERMRLTAFSELSAVCTLPEYTGRGYAQQLMAHLCRRQRAAGITPFLHVSKANSRALRLYEHLGFRHRRDITFWRVKKGWEPPH